MKPVLTKIAVAIAFSIAIGACGKDGGGSDEPKIDPTIPPVDPAVSKTIGFFLDDWQSRSFTVPSAKDTTITGTPLATITVDPYKILTKVPLSIFGENANVITSQFVNEPVLMDNINKLDPNFIRYPGGDNSSLFFWNAADGTLPPDVPSVLKDKDGSDYSPKYTFGKSNAATTLSLDNYYQLLQQSSSKGIISVNYSYARYSTSATPVAAAAHLAADWVRYDNGRTKYWEVGNENYGNWQAGWRINTANNKDGQPEIINGDIYGDQVNVIIDSMRKAATEIGQTIKIGAVLVEGIYTSSTTTEKDWNLKAIKKVHANVDFYSLHNFYTPFGESSTSAYIMYSAANSSKLMADYINEAFKTAGVEAKPLALTQYNINAVGSSQTASFVAGMHSIATLGEILQNNIGMAARFSLTDPWVNGNSRAMFSSGDEPGGVTKWTPRATFYYMQFFRRFLGDRMITSTIDKSSAEVLSYASSFTSKHIGVTVVNKADVEKVIKINLKTWKPGATVYWYVLTGGTDNGEFSRKVYVNGYGPAGSTGGPSDYATIQAYSSSTANGILIHLPKRATAFVAFPWVLP